MQLQYQMSRNGSGAPTTASSSVSEFRAVDPTKLVPPFDETLILEFFDRFEKIAGGNKWPKDRWSTLVQTRLKGKALKAYDSLTHEESQNYETLKKAVLRAYEMRPEAYRQKFRTSRKRPNDSYVDFARQITDEFDQWMRSEDVCDSYVKLKELVILENFLDKIDADLRTYLADKK